MQTVAASLGLTYEVFVHEDIKSETRSNFYRWLDIAELDYWRMKRNMPMRSQNPNQESRLSGQQLLGSWLKTRRTREGTFVTHLGQGVDGRNRDSET
jgi:hypothetical protein